MDVAIRASDHSLIRVSIPYLVSSLAGYTGQETAFFALIAAVRPKEQTPLVLFEGLPGEFSQHLAFLDSQPTRFSESRAESPVRIRCSLRVGT